MGSKFYKREGVWYVRTDPVTGRALSTGQRTVTLRDAWHKQRLLKSIDPNHKPEGSEVNGLNTWCAKIVERKSELKAAATASFYKAKLGHVVRILGIRLCGNPDAALDVAFAPENWDQYVKLRLSEGARATTIKKEIGCAKVVAKAGKRSKVFSGDISTFRPDDLDDDYEPGDRFLSFEEAVDLLDALNDAQRAHVALSIALATRYSEAFTVTENDVDLDNWTVRIHGTKTKSSKGRIPIAPPFREFLLLGLPHLPLKPWQNQCRDLEAACKRAGIAKVTSNDLRRTHASWLTEAGVPDSITSRIMRHVDERMVRTIYGRSRADRLGSALDSYFGHKAPVGTDPTPGAPPPVQEGSAPKMFGKSKRQGTYRGVYWDKKLEKWHGQIAAGERKESGRRRSQHLGYFTDPVEAALTYDAAARKAFGRAAVCNFSESDPRVTKTLQVTLTSEVANQETATFTEGKATKSVTG